MKQLFYFTYGEERSTVYQSQVFELLNEWSKKKEWQVNLIQISDVKNNVGLNSSVNIFHIKRKNKLLISKDIRAYIKNFDINCKQFIGKEAYFFSRGIFSFKIAFEIKETLKLKIEKNVLEMRGVNAEETLLRLNRAPLYFYMKRITKDVLKKAQDVTTVTQQLASRLQKKYKFNNNITVIPTLSINVYEKKNFKRKNGVIVGKVAWISRKQYNENINELSKYLNEINWGIDIIGSKGNTPKVNDVDRMSPEDLKMFIKKYHFGILFRNKSIINMVSSPTKLSDYLCEGMPVIYTGEIGSIRDFLEYSPESSKMIINLEELDADNFRERVVLNINEDDREKLAKTAQLYFGIKKVTDRYIKYLLE